MARDLSRALLVDSLVPLGMFPEAHGMFTPLLAEPVPAAEGPPGGTRLLRVWTPSPQPRREEGGHSWRDPAQASVSFV